MKGFFQRYLPDPVQLRSHQSLRFLDRWLHDPCLWHFNRRSTIRGLAFGMFFAFVPFPWQTLLAAIAAVWLRFNLPVAVAMVWISNPLTMPPIAFVNYHLGAWLLGTPTQEWAFEPSLDWLLQKAGDIGLPLLVGSMAMAVLAGAVTFIIAHLLWRWHIINKLRRRRAAVCAG